MMRIFVALAGAAILCCLDIARNRPVAEKFQSHAQAQDEIPSSWSAYEAASAAVRAASTVSI